MTAIERALTRDLLSPQWRARVAVTAPAVEGHCAIAAEALYYLAGGKEAGMLPVVCTYFETPDGRIMFADQKLPKGSLKSTHWWVRGPQGALRGKGFIHDPTAAQYRGVIFPYERGRGTGFQQPQCQPSRRAQIIIDRVKKNLGPSVLEAFKARQIQSYKKACGLAARQPG